MAMEGNEDNKKRARKDYEDCEPEANSVPNLKLARLDSGESGLGEPDPDDDLNAPSPDAKRIQEALLNILDDSDAVVGPDPAIQGLDSFIKSFEEEILVPSEATGPVMASDSDESRPELGFLLEASDDELGLPPSFASAEEQRNIGFVNVEEVDGSGAAGFGDMMRYEFPIPSYESFEFGFGGDWDPNYSSYSNSGDFVALGGLFESAADISGADVAA